MIKTTFITFIVKLNYLLNPRGTGFTCFREGNALKWVDIVVRSADKQIPEKRLKLRDIVNCRKGPRGFPYSHNDEKRS